MSLGPVMLDINGVELTKEDREILAHPLVGGVILFSRNYAHVEQLSHLTDDIHSVRKPELLIAVDHEGGRVQRFVDGFTRLPAAARIGQLFEHDSKKAKHLANTAGWIMAIELRSVGVDFSFAPVLDIDYGISKVIGDRAFHQNPDTVHELSFAYSNGMHEAGMATVGKHFPGHGAVSLDSHVDIPVDDRDFETIYANDIRPYRLMIKEHLTAIMPAHVIYPKIDALPAGFSRHWLNNILREKLQFQGVIFSDDLDMKGASVAGEAYSARAKAAVQAGCDMVLVCNNREAAVEVLDNFGEYSNPVAYTRLARMHGRHSITRHDLTREAKWHDAKDMLQEYLDDPTYNLEL